MTLAMWRPSTSAVASRSTWPSSSSPSCLPTNPNTGLCPLSSGPHTTTASTGVPESPSVITTRLLQKTRKMGRGRGGIGRGRGGIGSAAHRHRAGLVVAGSHHQMAKARVFFYLLFHPLTAGLGWAGPIQKLTATMNILFIGKRKGRLRVSGRTGLPAYLHLLRRAAPRPTCMPCMNRAAPACSIFCLLLLFVIKKNKQINKYNQKRDICLKT